MGRERALAGRVILLLSILLGVLPARAAQVAPYLSVTAGNARYRSVYGDVDVRNAQGFELTPAFATFDSAFTSGTFKTFSVRGGYNSPDYWLGLTGGGTPRVDGYSNSFFAFDGGRSLNPAASWKSESWVDCGDAGACLTLGAVLRHTSHTDDFAASSSTASAGVSGRTRSVRRSSPLRLGETDLVANVALSDFDTTLSGTASKSLYTTNLSGVSAGSLQIPFLSGVAATVETLPNAILGARVQNFYFPVIAPYLGYSSIDYELLPPAHSLTAGVEADFSRSMFSASCQFYRQPGLSGLPADQLYCTLSASALF